METHSVILFDGICNLCNGFVNFVIDRDPKGKFKFAAIQSSAAAQLLSAEHSNLQKLDSIVLVSHGQQYRKSGAVLQICKQLNGVWPMLYIFIIVPPFIRDAIYNFVARNRYKWFGKRNSCRMPEPAIMERFLEG